MKGVHNSDDQVHGVHSFDDEIQEVRSSDDQIQEVHSFHDEVHGVHSSDDQVYGVHSSDVQVHGVHSSEDQVHRVHSSDDQVHGLNGSEDQVQGVHNFDDKTQQVHSFDDRVLGLGVHSSDGTLQGNNRRYDEREPEDDGYVHQVEVHDGPTESSFSLEARTMRKKQNTKKIAFLCTNRFSSLQKHGGKSFNEILESINNPSKKDSLLEDAYIENLEDTTKKTPKQLECMQSVFTKLKTRKMNKCKKRGKSRRKQAGKTVESSDGQKVTEEITQIIVRCSSCFYSHFPYQKLCRRFKAKHKKVSEPKAEVDPSQGPIQNLVDNYFSRSKEACNPIGFPDIASANKDVFDSHFKLRGGGNSDSHAVAIKSDDQKLNSVLSFYRDMSHVWKKMVGHELCDHKLNPSCFYCLLRSLSLRSKNKYVKTPVSPVEVLGFLQNKNFGELSFNEMMSNIMINLTTSEKCVSTMFKSIYFNCNMCDDKISLQDSEIISLESCEDQMNIQEKLNDRLLNLVTNHYLTMHQIEDTHKNTEFLVNKDHIYIFFSLDKNINYDLESSIEIGGTKFNCISGIANMNQSETDIKPASIFKYKDGWAAFDSSSKKQSRTKHQLVKFLVFESEDHASRIENEGSPFIYERSVLNGYFRSKTLSRKESTRKRKAKFDEKHPQAAKDHKKSFEEKHPEAAKKHQDMFSEKHPESGRKRKAKFAEKHPQAAKEHKKGFDEKHPEAAKKHQDMFSEKHPESLKERQQKFKMKTKITEIEKDTGMEQVCAVCLERKSSSQCSRADKLDAEDFSKYIVEHKLALSLDGNLYICLSCKGQMKQKKKPRRSQKELFGFLNFPESLKVILEALCKPKNMEAKHDPEKKYLIMNRCEDYLLKLCIPFIRVAHLPRGRYFKVIGDLILISADLMHTMEKIIPHEQSLIPISFKRRLQYKGHYIEEHVDKEKLLTYFEWFRKNNHLFKDFIFDTSLVDQFISSSMKQSKEMDEENDENELNPIFEQEFIPSNHSTHLRNKYVEDIHSDTVANNLADLIVHLEKQKIFDEKKIFNEEEEIFYSDDEDEIDDSDEDVIIDEEERDNNEVKERDEFEKVFEEEILLMNGISSKCSHTLDKVILSMYGLINDIEKIESIKDDISLVKKENIKRISSKIQQCTELKKSEQNIQCNHSNNESSNFVLNFEDDGLDETETLDFTSKTARNIKEKAGKIYVAPGEKGKFMNWQQNIFIEEMAFPALFPYGIGGYLSSNILSGSDIGFANYCRNRIMSADPKYRNDQNYLFFLLLVKELIEMKRSKATFLRKAAKHPNLTKNVINEIKKENLSRNNNVFNVYKNLRGSAPYYQKAKKDLFATIRQHGSPTLFQTFSCAEFEWDVLCQKIYETVYNEKIDIEVIKNKDKTWKNKLVSENVVQ